MRVGRTITHMAVTHTAFTHMAVTYMAVTYMAVTYMAFTQIAEDTCQSYQRRQRQERYPAAEAGFCDPR